MKRCGDDAFEIYCIGRVYKLYASKERTEAESTDIWMQKINETINNL
jgi:hypothetical protein